jgi:hypothetical protein
MAATAISSKWLSSIEPDDEAGIQSANQLVGGHDVELCQLDRRAANFERKAD